MCVFFSSLMENSNLRRQGSHGKCCDLGLLLLDSRCLLWPWPCLQGRDGSPHYRPKYPILRPVKPKQHKFPHHSSWWRCVHCCSPLIEHAWRRCRCQQLWPWIHLKLYHTDFIPLVSGNPNTFDSRFFSYVNLLNIFLMFKRKQANNTLFYQIIHSMTF